MDAFPGLTFVRPVALVSAPGETNRLFVVEKGGRIFVITNLAAPNKTLFLDLSSKVREEWYNENGVLGMAFHPLYRANSAASSNYLYVFYTVNTTTGAGTGFHDRLARFQINPANHNQALLDSELPLISQFDEAANHNAGDVHFGPDGYLYVSTGDEGGGEDAFKNSRFINQDFFSAVLRLDVDQLPGSLAPHPHSSIHTNELGEAHYRIPPDNPFLGATSFNGQAIDPAAVRTEFWAVGLRNPWRMSFDPVTGLLYCGDVGQYQIEEIDIIARGRDYGWNYKEGFGNFRGIPTGTVTEADLTAPIVAYPHANGPLIPGGKAEGNAVTGGIVYRGDKYPELYGDYIFGDFGSGRIFALRYHAGEVSGFRQIASTTTPSAFGRDPASGDVLMAHFETFGGRIERLVSSEDPLPGDSLPPTLADTGAFSDLVSLTPEPGILPYDINTPFWSDYARKYRWFSVPDTNQTIGFSPTGNWSFPTGTVWIKHFELELTNGVPESARRLETRFLVRNADGVYGVTYRWGYSLTNADLVPPGGLDETFVVNDGGILRTQVWHYPSRSECARCHTPAGGLALGFSTAQLNRSHDYAGTVTNQLLALSAAGYFDVHLGETATLPALAPAADESASVTHRVRSYLAANCVSCHQPGGGAQGIWDARFTTPLLQAGIVDGPLVNQQGNPNNRVIKPGSPANSMILTRLASLGAGHMPPLATSELNHEAIALLSRWITNELVSLSVTLSTNRLAYPPGSGLQILDPSAQLTLPDLGSLAGTRLVAWITNGVAEDRLTVVASDPVGVSGSLITFGGVAVGSIAGGADGLTPLTITFGTNSTPEAAQAVLRHLAYENVSVIPSLLPRELEFTMETFYGATSAPASLTISMIGVPVNPVITWAAREGIVYGTPLTVAQLNAIANTPGEFAYDPDFGAILNAGGGRLLSVAFAPRDTVNFNSIGATATINVSPAPLTITAEDKNKIYGALLPVLSASYSGFVNGDSAASLDVPVTLATSATTSSPVGTYPITASGASDANYAISYVTGTLTVEPNAEFTDIAVDLDGEVQLTFTGQAARTYRLEFSVDLMEWHGLAELETGPGGLGSYSGSSGATNAAACFYRLVWP